NIGPAGTPARSEPFHRPAGIQAACLALCLLAFTGVTQAATTITTTTSYDYDTSTGLLKKTMVEPGDSNLCLVTEYTLGDYGHLQASTTRNCNGSAPIAAGATNDAAA